jgi:hypothetical protein
MQRALLVAPMDLGESLSYLRHHLALVGRTDPLFADDAVGRLHRVANGLHRQAQQRRHRRPDRRRRRRQGPGRQRQRQARRRRAHPGVTMASAPHLHGVMARLPLSSALPIYR